MPGPLCLHDRPPLHRFPSSMASLQSFRDLDTYQKARRQAEIVYTVTHQFPKEETYALSDQIRRSSRAVAALVAEAWGRRAYEAAFVNKLSEALGEAMETQSWLDAAYDCEYIDAETHEKLNREWQQIGGKLRRMIQQSDKFCD